MARTETVEFTNMCIEYDLVSYISVDELLTEIMPVPRNLIFTLTSRELASVPIIAAPVCTTHTGAALVL